MKDSPKKVCLIATMPSLVYMFSRDYISYLRDHGWEVTVMTAPGQKGFGTRDYVQELRDRGARFVFIPMKREPGFFSDIPVFFRMWRFFLRHRFDVVHASHPKTMLLGTFAAFFAFQPNRIITVRGRAYENMRGLKRRIFVWLDRFTCFFAKKIVVVSYSLRDAMLRDRIGTVNSLTVIHNGSSQGCDVEAFSLERVDDRNVAEMRKQCRFDEQTKVVLFAGRLRRDKGIVELVEAFVALAEDFPEWRLLLVGHEETASDIGEQTRELIRTHPAIFQIDWHSDLKVVYAMSDIFVLPSWREGFPNVVLEASAMMLPVIATDAVGAVDSVVDEETGFIVPVCNREELEKKMRSLMTDEPLRHTLGRNGRRRVASEFDPRIIWDGLYEIYRKVLNQKMTTKTRLSTRLAPFHQEQLLAHWDSLSESQREKLAEQIDGIDFAQLAQLYENRDHLIDVAGLVARAKEPPAYELEAGGNAIKRSDAVRAGRDALSAGKVAVLVVAGGQGTRLGFDHPKGMFPIGPVGDTTLFQIHVEKVIARARQYGKPIPFCVMTSPATHDETVEFFAKHERFGLAESDLPIFCQGTMPAVSLGDGDGDDTIEGGRVLLSAPDQIALTPDGHGGMLAAFEKSGCLDDLLDRGVEMLFYFQVDNPLVDIANEEFLGYHILSRSELTSQVIRKQSPQDRVGNIVSIDDRLHVIEYSDLPDEFAERRKPDGSLEIWAGSIATHVMGLEFLKRQAANESSLPFHVAKKKVPYINANGNLVKPSQPNAIKFERFIFDLLPAAQNTIVVEVDLWHHFAPLKNASGAATDSPEIVREQLSAVFTEWLNKAGVKTAPGIKVEISPLFANSPEMLVERIAQGLVPGANTGIEHDIRL